MVSQIGRKQFIEKGEIEELLAEYGNFGAAARNSKYGYHALSRRAKELGITPPPRVWKVRPDGYHNYDSDKNHRRIMEAHLGIKLSPRQGVHHINGDKIANQVSNLIVTDGTADHMAMHASLQRCAFELVRKGVIVFDRADRKYKLPKS